MTDGPQVNELHADRIAMGAIRSSTRISFLRTRGECNSALVVGTTDSAVQYNDKNVRETRYPRQDGVLLPYVVGGDLFSVI